MDFDVGWGDGLGWDWGDVFDVFVKYIIVSIWS